MGNVLPLDGFGRERVYTPPAGFSNDQPPLLRAVWVSDVLHLMHLIREGEEVNCKDANGYTALHVAAEMADRQCLQVSE